MCIRDSPSTGGMRPRRLRHPLGRLGWRLAAAPLRAQGRRLLCGAAGTPPPHEPQGPHVAGALCMGALQGCAFRRPVRPDTHRTKGSACGGVPSRVCPPAPVRPRGMDRTEGSACGGVASRALSLSSFSAATLLRSALG
eukprot:6239362-Prymnesium_polylepis.1